MVRQPARGALKACASRYGYAAGAVGEPTAPGLFCAMSDSKLIHYPPVCGLSR